MTRFRADYQRRIEEQPNGTTVHTLFYPESSDVLDIALIGTFALQGPAAEVGTVEEAPDGTATARATDGTDLGGHADADTAIKALIKHDQAQHN